MVIPSIGSIILIPFPFTDLSKSKLRPALVVADAGKGDWILVQITSKPYSDPNAIELNTTDFSAGSLRVKSFVRPGKLFTADQSLIHKSVATLKPKKFQEIISGIIKKLKAGVTQT